MIKDIDRSGNVMIFNVKGKKENGTSRADLTRLQLSRFYLLLELLLTVK